MGADMNSKIGDGSAAPARAHPEWFGRGAWRASAVANVANVARNEANGMQTAGGLEEEGDDAIWREDRIWAKSKLPHLPRHLEDERTREILVETQRNNN